MSKHKRYLVIDHEPLEKTKKFMRLLCKTHIPGGVMQTGRLECADSTNIKPKIEAGTLIDSYIERASTMVSFILGYKSMDANSSGNASKILFMMRNIYTPENLFVERCFWFTCPFDDYNYSIVKNLFHQAYEADLGSYKSYFL